MKSSLAKFWRVQGDERGLDEVVACGGAIHLEHMGGGTYDVHLGEVQLTLFRKGGQWRVRHIEGKMLGVAE